MYSTHITPPPTDLLSTTGSAASVATLQSSNDVLIGEVTS